MGRALPGWSCAVLANDADVEAPAGEMGRVAIDTRNSPLLWFSGYLDAPEKTAQRYTPDGRWYLTGDAGARDDDGCYLFSARDDDVIIMAGYRIGPFEVESVLVMHDSVDGGSRRRNARRAARRSARGVRRAARGSDRAAPNWNANCRLS